MMKNLYTIEYKLTARSPIQNAKVIDDNYIIHGSSLIGAIRQSFIRLNSKSETIISEDLIFGGATDGQFHDSSLTVYDAISPNDIKMVEMHKYNISNHETEIIHLIPKGTEFYGRIVFNEIPNGFERSVVLSSLLDMPNIGAKGNLGWGQCDIKILNRSNTIVFISYSWEESSHMDWVRHLAMKLIKNGIDIVLDQLSPSFDMKAPQKEINNWMKQSMANSDKILAVLTPLYRQKANYGIGGVGYEYLHLRSEKELISEKLNRYIGILRKGSIIDSTPSDWSDRPVFKMLGKQVTNNQIINVIQALNAS